MSQWMNANFKFSKADLPRTKQVSSIFNLKLQLRSSCTASLTRLLLGSSGHRAPVGSELRRSFPPRSALHVRRSFHGTALTALTTLCFSQRALCFSQRALHSNLIATLCVWLSDLDLFEFCLPFFAS